MDFLGLKFLLSLFSQWMKNLLPIDLKKPQQLLLQNPDLKRFVVYKKKERVKFVETSERVLCLFHVDILLVVLVALKIHRSVPFVVCEFDKKSDLLLFKAKVWILLKCKSTPRYGDLI